MGEIPVVDRAHEGNRNGRDRYGRSVKGREFDFKSLALPMNVNDGSHISGFQAILRDVAGQDDSVVFFMKNAPK